MAESRAQQMARSRREFTEAMARGVSIPTLRKQKMAEMRAAVRAMEARTSAIAEAAPETPANPMLDADGRHRLYWMND